MIDEFNSFKISIESDVASQDFDQVDLYGDIIEDTKPPAMLGRIV